MIKSIKIIFFMFLILSPVKLYAYNYFDVSAGINPMELSLFGGIASSDTQKDFQGVKADIGGSGFSAGFTALGLLNNYFGVGLDFSYTNDGYGKKEIISGNKEDFRIEHFTPLLFLKTYILSPKFSRLGIYVPLGAGMDFARISKRINGNNDNLVSDTLTGAALMGGIGAEVNFNSDTFIAVEGRYTKGLFWGSNDYDIKNSGSLSVLLKLGIKFNYGYDFEDGFF